MQISLRYGRRSVSIKVPKERVLGVVKPDASIPIGRNVLEALASPIGTETLPKLVDRTDKVALVVSDITRPCPTRRILPHILRELKASGVPRHNLRILIGTGTHRGHTSAEKERLIGNGAHRVELIADHTIDATQYVGTTKRTTKVHVNSLLLDSDFVLAIGNVDMHYFAGYTGGHKAVVPGLAGKETIDRNHSLMMLPNAKPGVAESNPVREDLEEAGARAGLRFILNVVLDEEDRIIASFAGDPVAAHRSAARIVDRMVKAPIAEPADVVIASAGGYPRDVNFYQAHKAIENASYAVKDGGTVILIAECSEGFANATFQNWTMKASGFDEIRRRLCRQFVLGAHKTYSLSKIAERANIVVVSDKMTESNPAIFKTCRKPQEAVDHALRSHGNGTPSVLLMPYAMNTLPVFHG